MKNIFCENKKDFKNILVCRPTYFGIDYEINPWMSKNSKTSKKIFLKQWDLLCKILKESGAKLNKILPQKNLPDMVFTANAGLYLKDTKTLVVSKFKHKERQGETKHFADYFENRGDKVVFTKCDFEGAGDCLFLGEHLVGGHGFRTDIRVYEEIKKYLEKETKTVRLIDPRFYHLDTCFCPLENMDYLIFPKAFEKESLGKIRKIKGNEIIVPEEEAIHFACNAVQIFKTIIIPSNCPKTCEKLSKLGYTVIEIPMTEFLKSGGACKCLTLAI